jgi:DNA invertase Pin-like site-specific DNA recombinase
MAHSRKKKNFISPTPGWAVYLRTSDEESQNPEASQARQRFLIEKAVLERSDIPIIDEYIDLLTGRTPHRTSYQQMLIDARMGKFSHVIVERADRFGRNDTEALRAIDELDEFGVAVRFANQPDLNPMSPDDRVIVALSFTLARRESMLTSMRIKGAVAAKRASGGYIGRAPDGYISVEDDQPHRKNYARRTHHIELDTERAPIWRLAWDLLLEDRHTLAEIAEELHTRGYRYRSGRPFVEVKANGRRKANYNTMAHIFHNWTYAGWIVSGDQGILPKTQRGNWQAIVSTHEFEKGLQILQTRSQHKYAKRKHHYLLKGLLFLMASASNPTQSGDRLYRLTGSTSNAGRTNGGTPHYRLQKYPIHFLCHEIDERVTEYLQQVQIDESVLPQIREYYINDVADKLGRLRPNEREEIERTLKQIDEEEARVLRLYAASMVTEDNWRNLWAEWQDKRNKLRVNLELLDEKCENYIDDLDEALTLITKLSILYETLSNSQKRELLNNVIERVIVNLEGEIVRVNLLPPFSYLIEVCGKLENGVGTSETATETQTGDISATCSSQVLECGHGRIRTYNQLIKSQLRCRCATCP